MCCVAFDRADRLMERYVSLRDHREGLKGQSLGEPAQRSDCCREPLLVLAGIVCCYRCRRPCQLSDLRDLAQNQNSWQTISVHPTRRLVGSSVDEQRAWSTSQWLVLALLFLAIPEWCSRGHWGYSLVCWECSLHPNVERATRTETAFVVAQVGRWAHPWREWHPADVRDAIRGARHEIERRWENTTARQRLQVGI
jgi:hypothetical protein